MSNVSSGRRIEKMDHTFALTTRTPVFLYGAASVGKIIYQRNPALHVCGFIDKRADEIQEFMGLPVYSLKQMTKLDREAVLVISVKNVFEQEDIAVSLSEAGFNKLIYKSNAVLRGQGPAEEAKLSEVWDILVEGRFVSKMEGLCRFQRAVRADFLNRSIIREENGWILSYLPIELIYTNQRGDIWSDLNIQGYYPHIYFFYYLSNHRNGQIEDYVKFAESTAQRQGDIKITDAWRRNVVRNRTDVYENMRASLDMDPDFFYRNAATAVWNENGYFNLTSGKHRCAFFVSQGYRYVPVKVPKADYQKFLEYGSPESIRKSIVDGNRRHVDTKIYHPWFYWYPCVEPPYYSYFQIEVLCRSIRFAAEHLRTSLLYTNLEEKNSMRRLLRNCRLVELTSAAEADILLLDTWGTEEDPVAETRASGALMWRIGPEASGPVLAEYISERGNVYLYEDIRKVGG